MNVSAPSETTDVIICGCGPTGAMLSAGLGQAKIANIVLEKAVDITTDPRGIALDEDGIRALQSLGLYDKIYTEIGRCMGLFNFVGGNHHDLSTPPFMRINYNTTEGGTGHVGFICHKQPVLEKYLRQAMRNTKVSDLRVESTVLAIAEDENWVYVTYSDRSGLEHQIRSKFLVGADGKTGFTRKKYLEAKGIRMEQASQTSYEETWVALNWKMTLPTPQTHPDFPLWKLGYTPSQVYDLFFPENFRFLCNPTRPAVCGRFGLPEDRLWRFEFVVKKTEDGNSMAEPAAIRQIVIPYITHSGSRYGLQDDVAYPQDCIEVLRSRPFVFSARSCNRWAMGRVLLCGDSAHVFPPFGGQGIASGFRDACSLLWRLQVACHPNFKHYAPLFTAWYDERKQQLEKSLDATVENGRYVTESNAVTILLRNTKLWFLQLVPSWRHWMEMGPRRAGMLRYEYQTGMAFLPHLGGGALFPQVYCVSLENSGEDPVPAMTVQFTDDVIFSSTKIGLFQLVVIVNSSADMEELQHTLVDIDRLSNGQILGKEATWIIHDPCAPSLMTPRGEKQMRSVFRIATAHEFAQSRLCMNRPEPQYFDPFRLQKEAGAKRLIILRPDRFVFAACADKQELDEAAHGIANMFDE